MFRELFEEVGLTRKDVRVLYASKHWLRYKLPKRLLRHDSKPMCIGQKQRWFLLQLVGDAKNINMQCSKTPEFDGWRWVSFWYPVRQVVSFKKEVYRKAMKEFAAVLFDENNKALLHSETETYDEKKSTFSSHKQHYSKQPKRASHKYKG